MRGQTGVVVNAFLTRASPLTSRMVAISRKTKGDRFCTTQSSLKVYDASKLPHTLNVIRDLGCHRWSHANRLLNAAEVVKRRPGGDGCPVVFPLLTLARVPDEVVCGGGCSSALSRPPLRSSLSVTSMPHAGRLRGHLHSSQPAGCGSFPSFPIRPQWVRRHRAAPQRTRLAA